MVECLLPAEWVVACVCKVQCVVGYGITPLLSFVLSWQTTAGKALTDFKKIRLQEDVMAVLRTFISEQPSVKVGRCVCVCGRRTTLLWPHSSLYCCVCLCVGGDEEHVALFSPQEPMLRRLKDIRANLERSEFFHSHEVSQNTSYIAIRRCWPMRFTAPSVNIVGGGHSFPMFSLGFEALQSEFECVKTQLGVYPRVPPSPCSSADTCS